MKKLLLMIVSVFILLSACQTLPSESSQTQQSEIFSEDSQAHSSVSSEESSEESAIPEPTSQEKFDALLDESFISLVTNDTIAVHYMLNDPKAKGIEEYEVSFGTFKYPDEESISEFRAKQELFLTIEREELSDSTKRDYDLIEYNISMFEQSLKFFYYVSPLSEDGIHINLPLLMSEWDFDDVSDVTTYLSLLSTTGDFFDELIEFEKEKSRLGMFMDDDSAGLIIDFCDGEIINREKSVFISSFNERIDSAEWISDEDRALYKEKNIEVFDDIVATAYKELSKALKTLLGTGKNSKGYAGLPDGAEYYEYRLKGFGISTDLNELADMLEKAADESYIKLIRLFSQADLTEFDYNSLVPKLGCEEMHAYIIERMSGDFPALPDGISIDFGEINKGLRDYMSPAYYISSEIDDITESKIRYNPEYTDEDPPYFYTVLAHEGYPGHMLQDTYAVLSDLSDYSKLMSYSAYSEGWAEYIQKICIQYMDINDDYKNYISYSDEFTYFSYARMEIGIHYEGWNKDDFYNYINDIAFYTEDVRNNSNNLYDYIRSGGTSHSVYYAGWFEVLEMKKWYKELLGEEYSELKFHEEFIKYGDAPFEILKSWMGESAQTLANAA